MIFVNWNIKYSEKIGGNNAEKDQTRSFLQEILRQMLILAILIDRERSIFPS